MAGLTTVNAPHNTLDSTNKQGQLPKAMRTILEQCCCMVISLVAIGNSGGPRFVEVGLAFGGNGISL